MATPPIEMEKSGREVEVLKEVAKCFEAIAENYASKRKRPWSSLLEPVENAGLVLDAGSGSGRHAVHLAKQGCEVICLDIAKGMLKQAKELKIGLHLVQGDLRSLPFKDECFDAALCIAAIHHLPTKGLRLKALAELRRVLRSRGALLVTAWSRWQLKMFGRALKTWLTSPAWLFEFGDVKVSWSTHGGRYFRFYHLFTKGELRRLVEEAGLKIKWLKGYSPRPSIIPRNYAALAIKEVG